MERNPQGNKENETEEGPEIINSFYRFLVSTSQNVEESEHSVMKKNKDGKIMNSALSTAVLREDSFPINVELAQISDGLASLTITVPPFHFEGLDDNMPRIAEIVKLIIDDINSNMSLPIKMSFDIHDESVMLSLVEFLSFMEHEATDENYVGSTVNFKVDKLANFFDSFLGFLFFSIQRDEAHKPEDIVFERELFNRLKNGEVVDMTSSQIH